jgi:phage terminase large subunit
MLAVLYYEVDTKGNATVYKEIHESGLIVSEAAKRINEVTDGEKIDTYYAPPDLWNANRDTGKSTAEIFQEYGIDLIKTSNNREQGCLNVKEYLNPYEETNEQTGDKYITARLVIAEGQAPNLVRCLTKIQKDKQKSTTYANQPHELTHIVDSLRAFCCGRPSATKIKKEIDYLQSWKNQKLRGKRSYW